MKYLSKLFKNYQFLFSQRRCAYYCIRLALFTAGILLSTELIPTESDYGQGISIGISSCFFLLALVDSILPSIISATYLLIDEARKDCIPYRTFIIQDLLTTAVSWFFLMQLATRLAQTPQHLAMIQMVAFKIFWLAGGIGLFTLLMCLLMSKYRTSGNIHV